MQTPSRVWTVELGDMVRCAAVGGVAAGGSKCCVADDVVSVGCGIDGRAAAVANATGVGGGTEAADRSSVC